MSLTPDQLVARIRASARAAFEEVGPQIVASIKDAISVPVEYVRDGPRGGLRIIRSKPGEPPRMETGELRADVQQEITQDEHGTQLHVFDTMPYAGYLETGTSKMAPRPIWRGTAMDYAPVVAGACVQKLRESLG